MQSNVNEYIIYRHDTDVDYKQIQHRYYCTLAIKCLLTIISRVHAGIHLSMTRYVTGKNRVKGTRAEDTFSKLPLLLLLLEKLAKFGQP